MSSVAKVSNVSCCSMANVAWPCRAPGHSRSTCDIGEEDCLRQALRKAFWDCFGSPVKWNVRHPKAARSASWQATHSVFLGTRLREHGAQSFFFLFFFSVFFRNSEHASRDEGWCDFITRVPHIEVRLSLPVRPGVPEPGGF